MLKKGEKYMFSNTKKVVLLGNMDSKLIILFLFFFFIPRESSYIRIFILTQKDSVNTVTTYSFILEICQIFIICCFWPKSISISRLKNRFIVHLKHLRCFKQNRVRMSFWIYKSIFQVNFTSADTCIFMLVWLYFLV